MFEKCKIQLHALSILSALYNNLKRDLRSSMLSNSLEDGIPEEDFYIAVNYLESGNYISDKRIEAYELTCKVTAKGIDWIEKER